MTLKDLLEKIHHEQDFLINYIADQQNAPPHISKKNIIEEVKHNVLLDLSESFEPGFSLISDYIYSHLTKLEQTEFSNEVTTLIDNMASMSKPRSEDASAFLQKVNNSPDTLEEILDISNKTIETIYQAGLHYFQNDQWKEARQIYHILSILCPTRYNIWFTLGICDKNAQSYEKALNAFAMATLIDVNAVEPHINSAECYLHLNQTTIAKQTFEHALELCSQNSDLESTNYADYIRKIMIKGFTI